MKKKRKNLKASGSSLSIATDSSSLAEDSSINNDPELLTNSNQYTILVDLNTLDAKTIQHSKISTNFKNIALLHPSDILSIGIVDHVIIKGKDRIVLCFPLPLPRVRRSTIVLPKDSMGFAHKDAVILYPFTQTVYDAEIVHVKQLGTMKMPYLSTDSILKKLCNTYFCCDTKIKISAFNFLYEFSISKISSIEKKDSTPISSSSSYELLKPHNLTAEQPLSSDTDVNIMTTFSQLKIDDKESPEGNVRFDHVSCDTFPAFFQTTCRTSVVIDVPEMDLQGKLNLKCPKFDHIGGLDDVILQIKNRIDSFLLQKEKNSQIQVILLHGPRGCGKSLILNAICNELDVNIQKLDWWDLYSRAVSDFEHRLRIIFENLTERMHNILMIDDFHYLLPSENKDSIHHNMYKEFANFIEKYTKKILILCASSNSDYNDTLFKTDRIIYTKIRVPMPTSSEREKILMRLLSSWKHSLSETEICDCAEASPGFTGRDLLDSLNDAYAISQLKRMKGGPLKDTFDISLSFGDIKLAIKSRKSKVTASDVKMDKIYWNDIGGMSELKAKLRQIVECPLKYPDIFKRFNIASPHGILLYGPPGCSKTLIAKALATECNLNFISKTASDLLSKYVGESEKAIKDLFAQARERSPCIVFLDEIDALAVQRGSDSASSGVGDRIVSMLLIEIDGIVELQNVIIIGATNRPDVIDSALLRRGRFDHLIYVPLPDHEARVEILRIAMKHRHVDEAVDYECLASKMEGYTGAEIVNICDEAALHLLFENTCADNPVFNMKHFETVLGVIFPRTTKELLDFYEDFRTKFS